MRRRVRGRVRERAGVVVRDAARCCGEKGRGREERERGGKEENRNEQNEGCCCARVPEMRTRERRLMLRVCDGSGAQWGRSVNGRQNLI
mmetsp:Transcript_7917/g.20968  ORF Transcript_7917/g.20968 Transcript_7917/m.20968 type:complete len:89 (+) Transcript_7917:8-274(+)